MRTSATGTENELEAIRRAYSEEAMRIQREAMCGAGSYSEAVAKKDKIVCDKLYKSDIIDI